MANDIAVYAVSYMFARVAVIAGFAYLFYLVLRRPAGSGAQAATHRRPYERRDVYVPEDRC